MTDILIIHRKNSLDGLAGTWLMSRIFENRISVHTLDHGAKLPDVTGRHVVLMGCTPFERELRGLCAQAASLFLIESSPAALPQLANGIPLLEPKTALSGWEDAVSSSGRGCFGVFDSRRSPAGILWILLSRRLQDRPGLAPLIAHLEDIDQDRWSIEGSWEIAAEIRNMSQDDTLLDRLLSRFSTREGITRMRQGGAAIRRFRMNELQAILPQVTIRMQIGGYSVPAANLPPSMAEDAARLLTKTAAFAAIYSDGPQGRTVLLHAGPQGPDVSRIAALHDGGGNPRVAMFRARIGWCGDNRTSPATAA